MHRLVGIQMRRPRQSRLQGVREVIRRTISVGDEAELVRTVTSEDIAVFAQVTGDTYPMQVNEVAENSRRIGQCVVHGAFLNGIVSGLLGAILPARTSVVHQYLEFPNELIIGEEIKAKVEITLIKRATVECVFACEATQRKKVVLKGYAQLAYHGLKGSAKEALHVT